MKKLDLKQSKEIQAGKILAPASSWWLYQVLCGSWK
ncbi:hypothetical protein DOK67_0001160 [Enterococcus sp. DIV0212c]|nr:hypothetical protein A5881_001953 [Enterococcus termitis]